MLAGLARASFKRMRTPSSCATCFASSDLPLYAKLELRAITKNQRNRVSAVIMSSVIPSARYSCSFSPLKLANGRTAIDGLCSRSIGGDLVSAISSVGPCAGSPTKRYPTRGIVVIQSPPSAVGPSCFLSAAI